MFVRVRFLLVALVLLGVLVGSPLIRARLTASSYAAAPHAAPRTLIIVTTFDDDFAPANGTCSLREAVYAAVHDMAVDACPAGAAADTVALPVGTFTLTRDGNYEAAGMIGDLDITGTLELTGATSATTIIDGGDRDRIFEIFSGAVTMNDLTLRNGSAAWYGGAVRMHPGTSLTVNASTVSDNFVTWYKSIPHDEDLIETTYGGAIFNGGGTLTVTQSLLRDNRANWEYMGVSSDGGTIYAKAGSRTTILDSVIRTGAANIAGGVANEGTVTVTRSLFQTNEGAFGNSGTGEVSNSQFFNNVGAAISNRGTLTVNDSEMAYGMSSSGCGGGGLRNGGQATVSRAFIHHNRNAYGAGVFVYGGRTVIRDSAIVDNAAVDTGTSHAEICHARGGGVFASMGTLRVENTTIARNHAEHSGGGIYNTAQAEIINSTIVSNSNELQTHDAGEPAPIDGAGITMSGPGTGALTLTNTLVAFNTSPNQPGSDCYGTVISGGYNLITAPTAGCTITGTLTGNLIGVDALLDAPSGQDGAAMTWALRPNSPAIDAGSPVNLSGVCPLTDQRGFPRPVDGDGVNGPRCDIGAFERQAVEPPPATATPTPLPTQVPSQTPILPSPTATATASPIGSPVPPTSTPTSGATLAPAAYLPYMLR